MQTGRPKHPNQVPLGQPVMGAPPLERTDAARNRRKILAAAERLVAEHGVEALSMDRVARAAGVGVGTVYRRFTDLSGLAQAMLDEQERALQAAFLYGPPPLGPGAPAADRIQAFLHALLTRVEQQAALLVVAENMTTSARYRSAAYAVYHTHMATLLSEVDPDLDTQYLADAILAPLCVNLVLYQRDERGMSMLRVREGVNTLVNALIRNVARGT